MYLGKIVLDQTFSRIECGLGRSHLGRIESDQRILECELGMGRVISP